jgi:hypothetical protein
MAPGLRVRLRDAACNGGENQPQEYDEAMNSLPWYPVWRHRFHAGQWPRSAATVAAPRRFADTEVIRMRQRRQWAALFYYQLLPVVALLSLLLAACNDGGKGPGY